MRQERTVQASIFDRFAGHEIGRELKAMPPGSMSTASWPAWSRRTCAERGQGDRAAGAAGGGGAALRPAQAAPPAELSGAGVPSGDSASFRAFARLPHAWSPQKSVLHQTISALRAQTWEQINRTLLASAREAKLERGRVVRLNSTVTAALVHEPSDSRVS